MAETSKEPTPYIRSGGQTQGLAPVFWWLTILRGTWAGPQKGPI